MPIDDKSIIQSVDRALTLLEEIASTPGVPHTLTDLSNLLGIDRSSVFRLLTTLGRHGLVGQGDGGKNYKLGYGIYALASALRDQEKITDLVNPFLKRIVRETGENAHLAVITGNRCVFIDREKGTRTLSANTNIGDTEDLYCTAVGKSLISRCSRPELDYLFPDGAGMIAYTGRTITTPDALWEEIIQARASGFSVDDEEFEPNVYCIASPIINFESKVEAAIGISGPIHRIKPRYDELTGLIRTIGEEISALLGYNGEGR